MAATAVTVGVVARLVGVPAPLAVVLAVGAAFVVRGSVRRRRRITVPRLLVTAALLIGVSATSWSYTGALTDPGAAPLGDRTATWMREHHMNALVDTIEQRIYEQGSPSNDVVDPAMLPAPPPTASGGTTTTPMAAATVAAPATTTVTAPVDHTPPSAGPLIDASVVGEGQWTPNPRLVNGTPVTYTTFVRPDSSHTGVVAAAVVLDPTATRLVYVPGTREPGGSGWAWGSGIPVSQRADLVAAFNSGWKQKDKPGGIFTEGRTPAPLVDGKASIVIYADGHSDIGTWGTDVTMTLDVVSVRQNLVLIVDNGSVVDGLTTGGSGNWGKSKYQLQYTRRSAIGVTANGAVVYVAGSDLTTGTLAHALVQVGAVRAMELDIHAQHPTFNFFTPAPGTPDGVTGTKLLPEMKRSATRYLDPDQRDFFAVVVR